MFALFTNLRVHADSRYHMHARLACVSVVPVTCKEGRNIMLFEITATSEILPDPRPPRELARNEVVERPYHPMVSPHTTRAPGQFIVITNERFGQGQACVGYSRLPGTRINRQQSAASTTAIQARHISARLLSSFLTEEVSVYSHITFFLNCGRTSRMAPSLSRSS